MKALFPFAVVTLLAAGCVHPPPAAKQSSTAEEPARYPPVIVHWNSPREVAIPLKLIPDGEGDLITPVVALTMDGFVEHFLVDTGAQFTLVLPGFLARHPHAKTNLQSIVVSFRQEHTNDIVALKNLSLDFASIEEMPAMVTSPADLEYTNALLKSLGHPELSGTLGIDFLMAMGATIDLPNRQLVLKNILTTTRLSGSSKAEATPAESPMR